MMAKESIDALVKLRSSMRIIAGLAEGAKNKQVEVARALLDEISKVAKEALK